MVQTVIICSQQYLAGKGEFIKLSRISGIEEARHYAEGATRLLENKARKTQR